MTHSGNPDQVLHVSLTAPLNPLQNVTQCHLQLIPGRHQSQVRSAGSGSQGRSAEVAHSSVFIHCQNTHTSSRLSSHARTHTSVSHACPWNRIGEVDFDISRERERGLDVRQLQQHHLLTLHSCARQDHRSTRQGEAGRGREKQISPLMKPATPRSCSGKQAKFH